MDENFKRFPFGEWESDTAAPVEESAEERAVRLSIEQVAHQDGIFFNQLLKEGFSRQEALALVARGLG